MGPARWYHHFHDTSSYTSQSDSYIASDTVCQGYRPMYNSPKSMRNQEYIQIDKENLESSTMFERLRVKKDLERREILRGDKVSHNTLILIAPISISPVVK